MMNKRLEKFEPFDLVCAVVFIALCSISILLLLRSHFAYAALSLMLAVWVIVVLAARVAIGPAYLEGHIVRLLIKTGNNMKESDVQKFYAQYGSMDFVLAGLKDRGVIRLEGENIQLNEHEVHRGFKNKLMMWGARKVEI